MAGRFAKLDRRVFVVCAGLIGVVIALGLWRLGWLEAYEARTWDWRARFLAEKGAASDQIRLILVDQNSLDWGSEVNGWSWPWPREVYAAIISHCKRRGAKAVAVDILFTEPSLYGAGDDAALGSAMADHGRVAGTVFLGTETGAAGEWPDGVPPSAINVRLGSSEAGENVPDPHHSVLSPQSSVLNYPKASFPIPEVARSSALLCNVQLAPDPDGVYRRVSLFGRFDGRYLSTLGLGPYFIDHPETGVTIESGSIKVGDRRIPTDADGEAILRFRGPTGTHTAYSAAAVIQSEIRMMEGKAPTIDDPEAFEDKYVFVGFSAPGLFDLRPTPGGGVFPGVEIHATTLDNFLSGDFVRQVSFLQTLFLGIAMTLACLLLVAVLSHPAAIVGVALLFAALPPAVSVAYYIKGYWLHLVFCETALLTAVFFGVAVKYATEGHQKRFIKNAFKHYLSPAVIDQLISDPDKLSLGGERRPLSIFFSDIESFTSISEKLDPTELTTLLNEYLTAMTDIIISEAGTVDKYEGDAIIAFWNAPLEVPDHADRCVRAALRCQAKLARMRPYFREMFKDKVDRDIRMRIGINTGPAVVGNFGSHTKFDYTAIGDAVNLAARLEGANKEFGTYLMISGNTREAMTAELGFRELGRLQVIGKADTAVTVLEPMYLKEYDAKKEIYTAFAEGLARFYEGRLADAEAEFSTIARFDPAAAAYHQKCRELLEAAADEPDGGEAMMKKWLGVWVMTRK